MMMLSDFVIALLKEWQNNLPLNVPIGDKYYDIEEFFFDRKINEYILKLRGAMDYESRGDIVENIRFKVVK